MGNQVKEQVANGGGWFKHKEWKIRDDRSGPETGPPSVSIPESSHTARLALLLDPQALAAPRAPKLSIAKRRVAGRSVSASRPRAVQGRCIANRCSSAIRKTVKTLLQAVANDRHFKI
jgi:hypothetical protein